MSISRRKMLKLGGAIVAAQPFSALKAFARPDSKFDGVQIGIIVAPYNFPSIPLAADKFLDTLLQLNISAVEMQDMRVEAYAGARPCRRREALQRRRRIRSRGKSAPQRRRSMLRHCKNGV